MKNERDFFPLYVVALVMILCVFFIAGGSAASLGMLALFFGTCAATFVYCVALAVARMMGARS